MKFVEEQANIFVEIGDAVSEGKAKK